MNTLPRYSRDEAMAILTDETGYTTIPMQFPDELIAHGRRLCHAYNHTSPDDTERRRDLLRQLFGTGGETVIVEPDFRCDYGFNIHFEGFAFVNYNVVILDTSPVHIGAGAFIAPGVCISCAGHAIHPDQRSEGLETSKPIHIGRDVWIGANATVCGGVTIGNGSVVGAGAVVVRDVPPGVVAAGNPCRVIRSITDADITERRHIVRPSG